MPQPSIRWKLTAWYGLILALLLTGFSATVYWTMRHHLMERIDQGLAEELADVRYEVERAIDAPGLTVWLDRRFARHEGFDFQITRTDGTRFFASERLAQRSLPGPILGDFQPNFVTVVIDGDSRSRVLSVTVKGPEGPLTIQVGRSLVAYEHESRELLLAFFLAGPLTLAATLVGGYFLARRTLSPVQRMTETAREIGGDRLTHRVAVTGTRDELDQLAGTLNDMLDRLERSFAEMQRFTADAAHELRTPLAVIRSEAEVALRSPRSSDEYGRVLENVLEETVRLSRMADELLFLCRQDAGLNPQAGGPVELGPLLDEVVGNMRLVAQEKGIALTLDAGVGGIVTADGRQLRRVFYNLIDNAVKYTPSGGQIRVGCRQVAGEMVVTVSDTGVGISEEHLPRIFDRFYRVDPARTGDDNGAGLGLAICQSVIRVLGGRITVESSVGRGTTFVVGLKAG